MKSAHRIRVLVVDDSAFARKVMREVLSSAAGIEVVGTARDGIDALESIASLQPDVVTLDLHMPELDGAGVLAALDHRPTPRVVVVSTEGDDTAEGLAALRAGAIDVVRKPTATANDKLYQIGTALLEAVRAAASARVPIELPPDPAKVVVTERQHARQIVVIGASTGGPQAVQRILSSLPGNFPVPIAIVLHMPIGYTSAYAERVDRESALTVMEASDALVIEPGMAVIARAGMHLRLERSDRRFVAKLDAYPTDTPHRPSVDVLFESAASAAGSVALGVVLTGMGDDGTRGARALRAAGAAVLTQSESSCVVYGMPRAVAESGSSSAVISLGEMATAIAERL